MDFLDFDYLLLIRLFVAAILGGLVGLERGRKNHEAGLRTHIILCIGAASVMVIGESLVRQYGSGDIMRMGAQVISGVGFLGAGSIMLSGNRVKGLTTATGLWTTACVGLAVGSGYYIIAMAIVILMLIAMWGMRSISTRLEAHSYRCSIKVVLDDRNTLKKILQTLINEGSDILSVKQEENETGIAFILTIKINNKNSFDDIISELAAIEGVNEFTAM